MMRPSPLNALQSVLLHVTQMLDLFRYRKSWNSRSNMCNVNRSDLVEERLE